MAGEGAEEKRGIICILALHAQLDLRFHSALFPPAMSNAKRLFKTFRCLINRHFLLLNVFPALLHVL